MWGGKPAKGVVVAYDGDVRGVTGVDGHINLRIRHRGRQFITAWLKTDQGNDPENSPLLLFS